MSTKGILPYAYGYCMLCGVTRQHQLTRLGWQCTGCRQHQWGEPADVPKTKDWSGLVAWAIIGLTAAYVVARLPW